MNVHTGVSIVPPARYTLSVEFEAAPERIDQLADAAIADLVRLTMKGPTKTELDKVRAAEVRDLDGKMESNGYWASELSWHARMGWPLASIASHQRVAEHLTMEGLRDACSQYLRTSSYTRVTMYPKNGARGAARAKGRLRRCRSPTVDAQG